MSKNFKFVPVTFVTRQNGIDLRMFRSKEAEASSEIEVSIIDELKSRGLTNITQDLYTVCALRLITAHSIKNSVNDDGSVITSTKKDGRKPTDYVDRFSQFETELKGQKIDQLAISESAGEQLARMNSMYNDKIHSIANIITSNPIWRNGGVQDTPFDTDILSIEKLDKIAKNLNLELDEDYTVKVVKSANCKKGNCTMQSLMYMTEAGSRIIVDCHTEAIKANKDDKEKTSLSLQIEATFKFNGKLIPIEEDVEKNWSDDFKNEISIFKNFVNQLYTMYTTELTDESIRDFGKIQNPALILDNKAIEKEKIAEKEKAEKAEKESKKAELKAAKAAEKAAEKADKEAKKLLKKAAKVVDKVATEKEEVAEEQPIASEIEDLN